MASLTAKKIRGRTYYYPQRGQRNPRGQRSCRSAFQHASSFGNCSWNSSKVSGNFISLSSCEVAGDKVASGCVSYGHMLSYSAG